MNIDDFYVPTRNTLTLLPKDHGNKHKSTGWWEPEKAGPSEGPESYGPSVEEIFERTHQAHDEHGEEFDPEFHSSRIRVGKPLDFNE